ncbi:MAG TPA: hypothetical protein VFR09_07510 [Alphaproteobacteria bacterium]|nr:hypothetical protein [Alphaproteobacteria bacterium]
MAWETFERTRWRNPSEPTVTLTATGRVSLNVAIINDYLGDNKYATFMFDREKKLVAIKFTKQPDTTTYPIFVNKVKSSAAINAFAFLKKFELIPSLTTNYLANFDGRSKLLIFSAEKSKGAE